MPYTICKEFAFAAAHHIPGHPGKCRNLHGHNYRVRVFVHADALDTIGMVIDFADLKKITEAVVGHFDHQVINEHPPFDRVSPTAEELAAYVHRGVTKSLTAKRDWMSRGVAVARIEVWENDTSCAIFES